MIIKVRDIPFFKSIIRSMNNIEYITFRTAHNKLIISSALINIYHAEIDSTLLEFTEYQAMDFSVNANLLKKILKFFKTQLIIKMNSSLELCYESAKKNYDISVPFIKTIKSELNEMGEVETLFVVQPIDLNFLQNFKKTTYECADKLVVKQNVEGGAEEMVFEVDILRAGGVSFTCDNLWLGPTKSIRSFVENVVYTFDHSMLQVTFVFRRQKDCKFIVQIPKLYERD
ncbi:hypothetical protein THOM_2045 [Trachipleistophora hominis]|uniref:Checkpoint 9-1-1 complex, RAD1 component n=1 Tax=Trachipleistophora hominis TaxID=72359 RepID=L7JU44_TRAHO|nr:hypothetical protein THOM_2045 [Trachipleistophora hominis]